MSKAGERYVVSLVMSPEMAKKEPMQAATRLLAAGVSNEVFGRGAVELRLLDADLNELFAVGWPP